MHKTFLIHGYACDIDSLFHRPKDEAAGFDVFKEELVSQQSTVFRWGFCRKYTFWESFLPTEYLHHYNLERKLAADPSTLSRLHEELFRTQPSIIVCHSMGCYVFIQYLQQYQLPKSVKKVMLLQGDVTPKEVIDSGMLALPIQFFNIFRTFDFTLWMSRLYHLAPRIGLAPIEDARVKNIHFSSFKHFNLHTALLSDRKLKKLILSS